MTFYRHDLNMQSQLEEMIQRFASEGRTNLKDNISITWIKYTNNKPKPNSGAGAKWDSNKPTYPASVVKLIYAIASEDWVKNDLIPDSDELRRALKDMISKSSNDATSLIIDLLTGSTSGPSLKGGRWIAWKKQRNTVNKWLREFEWTELNKFNCCQKTWSDEPYGREKDFYQEKGNNRNALTTDGTARLLEGVMTNNIISPEACKRLRYLLERSLSINDRKADPENQIDGFLGEGLPKKSRIWSKAGWMSSARHDAAWISNEEEQGATLIVVFYSGGKSSTDTFLLPAIANSLTKP